MSCVFSTTVPKTKILIYNRSCRRTGNSNTKYFNVQINLKKSIHLINQCNYQRNQITIYMSNEEKIIFRNQAKMIFYDIQHTMGTISHDFYFRERNLLRFS